MRVYRGRINWYNYAVNECCTFVFPGTFEVGQPVYCLWQWTRDANGNIKPNVFLQGHVNTNSIVDNKRTIGFHYENYYKFEAQIGDSQKSLTVVMRNPNGDKSNPTTLEEVMSDAPDTNYLIYTGKYNEPGFADNEMITLILSPTLAYSSNIGVFWQWTRDWQDHPKVMQNYVGTVTSYQQNANQIQLQFVSDKVYYKFSMTLAGSSIQEMKIKIASEASQFREKPDYVLKLTNSQQ